MGYVLDFVRKHRYFAAFTLFYFVIGFFTYKDFGVTYDEYTEYIAGKYLLTYYLTPTDQGYVEELGKYDPTRPDIWQLPLFSHYSRTYPMLLNIFNSNFYWEWFHFQNIVFGYFLFLFSYILYCLKYKKQSVSILAPIILFLTPVITGHIPANPKNIPFATVMLLGTLCIYYFVSHLSKVKKNLASYALIEVLILGVVFGVAQSLRTVGLSLFIIYVLYNLLLSHKGFGITLLKSFCIGLISLMVWVLLVPFVGANVFVNIWNVFSEAAQFLRWNDKVLYLGEFLLRDQRPWHYLFVYLLVQLPIFTLVGIFAGTHFLLKKRLVYNLKHPSTPMIFVVLLSFTLYLVLNPIVYNGLRHFLYVVVFLTLIAGFLIIDIYGKIDKKYKLPAKALLVSYFIFTFARMVILHPYEYVYYNELIGGLKGAEGKFELDYWGAAYTEAAKYVGKKSQESNLKDLKIAACDNHLAVDYYSQFRYTRIYTSKNAHMNLCDTFKARYRDAAGEVSYTLTHPIVKTISREGVSLLNIYALPEYHEYFTK